MVHVLSDISDRSRMDKATVVFFGYPSEYHRLCLLYTLSETSSKWALKIGRDPRGQDPLPPFSRPAKMFVSGRVHTVDGRNPAPPGMYKPFK